MKKIDILFLSIIMFIAIGICICMCLTSCTCEFRPIETPSASKIFSIKGCDMYYIDVIHENHEYLMSGKGGIIHKVNCKFCKGKINESNNGN